jgi:hypothetical protein
VFTMPTISTSLVQLLGGRIGLKSEQGQGSAFHFTTRFEMEPANGCRICMEAFPGVCETPWFGLAEGSVILGRKPAGPSAVPNPTSTSESGDDSQNRRIARRDPRPCHATRRRTLAILAVLPGLNLKKPAFEEGEQPRALQNRPGVSAANPGTVSEIRTCLCR